MLRSTYNNKWHLSNFLILLLIIATTVVPACIGFIWYNNTYLTYTDVRILIITSDHFISTVNIRIYRCSSLTTEEKSVFVSYCKQESLKYKKDEIQDGKVIRILLRKKYGDLWMYNIGLDNFVKE